jgi:hypothetical protein
MARDLAMSNSDIKFQQAVFGNNSDPESNLFTRATRRLIALIGMLNFATISILCTLYPGVELVTFTPPENKEAISILWGLVKMPSGADVTPQSQQGIFLWSQSPLWERSSGSISRQAAKGK